MRLPAIVKRLGLTAVDSNPVTERLFNETWLRRRFARIYGRPPNVAAPTTFNEKVLRKMLRDRRPLLQEAADKLAVRGLVERRVGRALLPELLAVFDRGAAVPWDRLPERFVLKATHGSGMVRRVLGPVDHDDVARELDAWLATDYYRLFREWAYRDIPRRLFAEELLSEGARTPQDFKFFVFNGHAQFLQVDVDRFTDHQRNVYDRDHQLLDLRLSYPRSPAFQLPARVAEMWAIAEQIAEGFDFVRVDLYLVKGRIVFGELTNYPGAGMETFHPASFDLTFGEAWVS